MSNTSAIYARIDTNLKENAEAILAQLGITPTALIQMTYSQVILNKGLPFEVKIPAAAPTAIGGMSLEQLSEELEKGMQSIQNGSSADELDRELAREFGI